VSRWHAIRIRDDLYRVIQAQAAEMSRSATGQLDFVLSRALEQEPGSLHGGPSSGQAEASVRPPAPSPARAPVAQRQTTVDEMLASCPNCAEELQPADALSGAAILVCPECSYVRDAT
jgi:hypothetical protein